MIQNVKQLSQWNLEIYILESRILCSKGFKFQLDHLMVSTYELGI